jgi:hypothetical protein
LIPQLFILGIDGLGADIVLDTDLMPNLKHVCKNHEHGVVRSPNNLANTNFPFPHTWPAWTTIWTGQSEEKHGIRMPDRDNDICQVITDQPYITIWEILDDAGYKCALNHVQMSRGLDLENGIVAFAGKNMFKEFFSFVYSIRKQLQFIKDSRDDYNILAYYTIHLDHWFHQRIHIDKELIFGVYDYLIQWCQWFCPTKCFIVVSDHGFDPDRGVHTNDAFYYSRRTGNRHNLDLTDIAGKILDHVKPALKNRLGEEVTRKQFGYEEEERRQLFKVFDRMGYPA